ncbi:unnamed protein product [Hymenolepis diminuta]|uniref:DH domain-containing protein n=1 Tax=Hymenolepis diminuta TaxID=6216 RepID=A0A564YJL0_HYMDI|nr:unnamed protein product [Hymenolepis diminuta]
MVNLVRMIITRTHSNPPNSDVPSKTSPKLIYVSYRHSSEIKETDTKEKLNSSNTSEEPRRIIDRSRNLNRAIASAPIARQKRSSSTGGKLPPHNFEGSQSMKPPQEMIEIVPSSRQEDLVKCPRPAFIFRNPGAKRRISSSAMTISRGNSVQATTPQDPSPASPPEIGEFIDMITKPTPVQRTRNSVLELLTDETSENNSSVFIAPPPANPDHLSPPPRLRPKIQNAATPDRNSTSNGSSYDPKLTLRGNSTVRHRLGQIFARSTPDINMEVRQTNAMQVEKLQNRLRCFENGKLPKIPPELYDYFPQNLPPHDFTAIEKMWDHLTSSSSQESDCGSNSQCKKNKDQQLSAIMELLYTEACYIKTLEMIINVHIAVYLDLTKSTVSNLNYNPAYRGGSLNRLADPMVPTELAPHGGCMNSVSSGTTSSSLGGMIRRMRGRVNHDYTSSAQPTVSSSSSLSNLSVFTLSDLPSFSAPPVEDIFGNIGSVYRANYTFWSDCFEPVIINDESLDVKFFIRNMQKAFSKFKNYFEPYAHFLETYNTLVSNIRYLDENNKFFSVYHEWTKTNNTLNSRESLSGLLAQPFQRITRYGILIKRIKESTTDEYEIAALTEMIEAVDDFVKEVNANQPEQEARAKLNDFIQRIHKYTFADTIRSDFGVEISAVSTDIVSILRQPMRVNGRTHSRKPIAEVQAKVKYVGGKVSDALCVLLSDMVLICKQSLTKRHLSVYRPPIFLTYLTIQQKKDNPGCYIATIRNDYGLLVDCYAFSSEEKDLEEWISQVLRQKAEILSTPRPIPVSRDSLSGSSCLYSTSVSVPDGSIYGFSRHSEYTFRPLLNDYHQGTAHGHYGSRRNSEIAWQRSHHTSVDAGSTVIGRPHQLLDGFSGPISVRNRRRSMHLLNGDHGDAVSPGTENVSVDKTKCETSLKSLVYKSTSSASDSSNTSNSTASSANTTSVESFGCLVPEAQGSISGVRTGILPKITRRSLGRVPFRNTESLKTDATVAKRQTS